jgi:hypothetical protein
MGRMALIVVEETRASTRAAPVFWRDGAGGGPVERTRIPILGRLISFFNGKSRILSFRNPSECLHLVRHKSVILRKTSSNNPFFGRVRIYPPKRWITLLITSAQRMRDKVIWAIAEVCIKFKQIP